KRDRVRVDIAPRQACRDLAWRGSVRESIFPGLQLAIGAREMCGQPKAPRIGHDAGVREPFTNRRHANARREIDEHLLRREAAIRRLEAVFQPRRTASRCQEENEKKDAESLQHPRASRKSCRMIAAAAASTRALRLRQSRSRSAS